jgi:glycosyltransferase involved in cell wall biosynthesis
MAPKVSFVVPCFNLAHLLADCVNSILRQSYDDFEILIMDDCSPDHTPEVARSFHDSRVRYVRNEKNLGNNSNYNKGINRARGQYVWLISADDCLRRDYVLTRYVQLMDDHPQVGYVFCPAIALQGNQESGLMPFTAPVDSDTIFKGLVFLEMLAQGNCVSAPAVMARKECYDRLSLYPIDMPYAGDWYVWCKFALHYDVAYFAEPMVNRRLHDRNLTKFFTGGGIETFVSNMIDVPWQIKKEAEAAGYAVLAKKFEGTIIAEYISAILANREQDPRLGLTLRRFEESLQHHTHNDHEDTAIRERVLVGLGDHYAWKHDVAQASYYYAWALRKDPWMLDIYVKYVLLYLGRVGFQVRTYLGIAQRVARRHRINRSEAT